METTERTGLLQDHGEDNHDESIVFWDGPEDPENPTNWPRHRIWIHVVVVSLLTFVVPLGATMFASVMQQVKKDIGSTDETLSSLAVSIYVLGWAVGPLVSAPLSEARGRLPVYTWSSLLYIVFTAGCATAPTIEVLVLCRFLAGVMGSTPMTIGGGTISDLVPVHIRGRALSIYMLGPILGPSVGPFVGAAVAEALSWRWIFWVLAIVYGVITIAQLALMRETFPAAILAQRTRALQKKTGNQKLQSKLDAGLSGTQILTRAIIRPAKITVTSPIVALLSLASAYVNGLVFLLLITAPTMYHAVYGFSPSAVGLTFLGYGAGNIAGLSVFTTTSDRLVRRSGSVSEARLLPTLLALSTLALGLIVYGWSAAIHAPWGLAVVGSGLVGAGNVLFFLSIMGYLIDSFTVHAATAVAANTVLRSVGGTLLPLAGADLFSLLGWGWGNSVLAVGSLVFVPILYYIYAHGERIREKYPAQV